MKVAVLADFGSTICKVTVVDPDNGHLLGHGEAPTFLGPDVMDGYDAAFAQAVSPLARRPEVAVRLSSSSAGGGLKMAAVGLVDEMTAAAAQRAALNAGGRLSLVLHGALDVEDVHAIDAADPEIVLFGGGTDGGQADLVLANASTLAKGSWSGQVIVACNRDIAERVAHVFRASGRDVHTVDNVMPRIGVVEAEAARSTILEVFLKHVIRGKNLSDRREFLDSLVTATPEAALAATRLLAHGTPTTPGVGHVAVIDIGGATTDVHSVTTTPPATQGRRGPLLPLPSELRTVNGDLGMRSGARGVVEADAAWLEREAGIPASAWVREAERRAELPSWIPEHTSDIYRDKLLGISCMTHALARHCGRQTWAHTQGESAPTLNQTGPDLRDVAVVVGTGGVVVHNSSPLDLLGPALDRAAQMGMSPESPELVVDSRYLLAAAGLLRSIDDEVALNLLTHALDIATTHSPEVTNSASRP